MAEGPLMSSVLAIRPEISKAAAIKQAEAAGAEAGAAFADAYQGTASKVVGEAQTIGAQAGAAAGDGMAAGMEAGAKKGSAAASEATVASTKHVSGSIMKYVQLGAAYVGYESIKAAAAAQQMGQTVDIVFGKSSEEVKKFAEGASQSLGLSSADVQSQIVKTGQILKQSLGNNHEEISKESIALTKRSADLAAMFGADQSDVMAAMNKAVATGMSRGLKQYGINLSEATLNAKALSMGIVHAQGDMGKANTIMLQHTKIQDELTAARKKFGDGSNQVAILQDKLTKNEDAYNAALAGKVPALTAAQKQQAAYGVIMDQSGNSADFFAKHSKNAAEQLKIVKAEVENTKESIGAGLLPVVKDLLVPIEALMKLFNHLPGPVKEITVGMVGLGLAAGPVSRAYKGIVDLGGAMASGLRAVAARFGMTTSAAVADTAAANADTASQQRLAVSKQQAAAASTAEAEQLRFNFGAEAADAEGATADAAAQSELAAAKGGAGIGRMSGGMKLMAGAGGAFLGYQGLKGVWDGMHNGKGETLGQAGEIIAGGAMLGSIVPGVGTALGAGIGAGIAGGIYVGQQFSGSGGSPINGGQNFGNPHAASHVTIHVPMTVQNAQGMDEKQLAAHLDRAMRDSAGKAFRTRRTSA